MTLSKRKLSPWFLFALLLVIGWVSLRVVRVFLDYALVGIFLAYLTYPGYKWLLARVKHRPVASMIMLLLVVASIVVPGAFLVSELIREITQLTASLSATNLTAALDDLQRQINSFVGGDPDKIVGDYDLVAIAVPAVRGFLSSLIADLPSQLAFGLIGVFVLLYIMYYIYIDGARLVRFIQELLPMQEAHRDLLFHETGIVVKAVMYGQVLTAMIQAGIAGIGYVIFGVPSVVLLSLATFVLALLPVVGPPLIWAPAAILLIVKGQTFAGVGLLIYSAILVSGLDNIIRPKLIGSRARVHPVVVLLGVLGGVAIFGMSGLILGPLVLSIFVTLLEVYRKEFANKMDDDGGFWVRS